MSEATEYLNLPSPIAEGSESLFSYSPSPFLSPPLLNSAFFPPSAPPASTSAPHSRRSSQHSMPGFGGLPPENQPNPRRGSATGSYGLPVPPDWLRSRLNNPGSKMVLSGRDSPVERKSKKISRPFLAAAAVSTLTKSIIISGGWGEIRPWVFAEYPPPFQPPVSEYTSQLPSMESIRLIPPLKSMNK